MSFGWLIHQYDVKNAFVHVKIDKTIYTELLEGYNQIMNKNIKGD